MGDSLIGRGWLRFDRHDTVVGARMGLFPIEADLERPQVNTFQLDRIRGYPQFFILDVPDNFLELVVQGEQVRMNIRKRRLRRWRQCVSQFTVEIGEPLTKNLHFVHQILLEPKSRSMPAEIGCALELPGQACRFLPERFREFDVLPSSRVLGDTFVNNGSRAKPLSVGW